MKFLKWKQGGRALVLAAVLSSCGGAILPEKVAKDEARAEKSGETNQEMSVVEPRSVGETDIDAPVVPSASETEADSEPARRIEAGFVHGDEADPTRASRLEDKSWTLADGRPLESLRDRDTIQYEAPLWLTPPMLVAPERWLDRRNDGRASAEPVFFAIGAGLGEEVIVNVFHSFEIFDHQHFALERGTRRLADWDEERAQWSIPVVLWLGARPGRLTPAMTIRASLELVLGSGKVVPLTVTFRVRTALPAVTWSATASPRPEVGTVRLVGSWSGAIENRGDRAAAIWFRTRSDRIQSWLVGDQAIPRLRQKDGPELSVIRSVFRQRRDWKVPSLGLRGSGTYFSTSRPDGFTLGARESAFRFASGEWQRLVLEPGQKAVLAWAPVADSPIGRECALPRKRVRHFEWSRRGVEVSERVRCVRTPDGGTECTESPRFHASWERGEVRAEETWLLRSQGLGGAILHEFRMSDVDLDPVRVLTDSAAELSELDASGQILRWESRGDLGGAGERKRDSPPAGWDRLPDWNC